MLRELRWLMAGALATTLAACSPGDTELLAPRATARAPGRATTQQENLQAFARVYGYVRWFHPTDAASRTDWRALAAIGVAQVRDAATLDELRTRLVELFGPLAPRLDLWIDGESTPAPGPTPQGRDTMVYWQHEGYVGTRLSLYAPPYGQVRVNAEGPHRRRFTQAPAPDARVEVELVPGLHLRLPTVLSPADAEHDGEAPLDDAGLAHAARSASGYHDLDVRQGAVIEVWNVFRHFYPYQDTVEIDWPGLLAQALADAENDRTVDDTAATLWTLVHALQDGHGMVGHREIAARGRLPVRVEMVDGVPTVTGTDDPSHFAIGDVIEAVDGVALAPRVAHLADRLSGSPQWRRFRAASWESLTGPRDAAATVKLRRGRRALEVDAHFNASEPAQPPRPPQLHRFDDGTYYVDLTRAQYEDLEPALPEIAAAPAVVFDMRGYPSNTHKILAHLLREEENADWMHVPQVLAPDGHIVGWDPIGWHVRPAEPHVQGKLTFLIDAEAISYAESILGYVEAHDLGTLVGTPSAGANGDIVRVDTLGGFFVIFTGMKVTRHDGSRFHVEGVQPKVAAAPTLAGLAAGRDEVLEAGLANARTP
ncbi:MAG: hypothetical protein IPK74_38255 [Deltaproteobacteria bacterium]|nr:hypothetical protein [Deltaproteobacteria bacterium]